MQTAEIETKIRSGQEAQSVIQVGQRVQLVSGALTGLAGVVVRCEKRQMFVIGVPDADSRVLVRVQRQRLRCQSPNTINSALGADRDDD